MLMKWCSNLLMRAKLSPLSVFVHMKGQLPCRGHCDRTLRVQTGQSVCVCLCVCAGVINVRKMTQTYTILTWHAVLLCLSWREHNFRRRSKLAKRCWGVQNRFNTFINSTGEGGDSKQRRLAGCPCQCAVTDFSAGSLWTVCNYLISEFIGCSSMPCQMTFFGPSRKQPDFNFSKT